jgi:hypothetical protein
MTPPHSWIIFAARMFYQEYLKHYASLQESRQRLLKFLPNLCINAFSLYRWLGKDGSFFLLTWSHSLRVSLMICGLETRQKFILVYTISWVTIVITQQIIYWFENSPEILFLEFFIANIF